MTCAEVRERAPELALGILRGAERAEVLLHLDACARCQAYVAELSNVADVIPQLGPEAEPPPGFEERVLRRLGEGDRRARRRRITTALVAAAAAAVISITLVRVIEARDATTVTAARSPGPVAAAPVEVTMRGGGDVAAGWAYVSGHHGLAISVAYGVPSGAYTAAVTPPGSVTTSVGTVRVVAGRGSWTGHSEVALRPGTRVALVDATGAEVCHGTVPEGGTISPQG